MDALRHNGCGGNAALVCVLSCRALATALARPLSPAVGRTAYRPRRKFSSRLRMRAVPTALTLGAEATSQDV